MSRGKYKLGTHSHTTTSHQELRENAPAHYLDRPRDISYQTFGIPPKQGEIGGAVNTAGIRHGSMLPTSCSISNQHGQKLGFFLCRFFDEVSVMNAVRFGYEPWSTE
jgi:hypothetical protein